MGHFGAQTGYPVVNVSVAGPDAMTQDGRKNYIVMGTVDDQPAIQKLDSRLPVQVNSSGLTSSGHPGLLRTSAACLVEGALVRPRAVRAAGDLRRLCRTR